MIDTTVDKPALVDQIIAAIGYRFAIVLLANYPVSCAQLDAPLDLRRTPGRKRGQCEEETGGICWRGTTIAIDSRLRIGRASAKTEEEVALELMVPLEATQAVRSHVPLGRLGLQCDSSPQDVAGGAKRWL